MPYFKKINKEMKKRNCIWKIKRFICWPYNAIKSSYLCIRFPFLYPRSLWNDKIYTNWKIYDYEQKHHELAYMWDADVEKWVVKNSWEAFKIKFLLFVEKYILTPFHIIPTYTRLNMMPSGWRKRFGIQMCKEIKESLLEDGRKKLKNYKILDIKEKYGDLRWNDIGGNQGTNDVIAKYEYISRYTCIDCGRPAKYETHGWVRPYCEKCIDKHGGTDFADKFYYDIPFYGYQTKFEESD